MEIVNGYDKPLAPAQITDIEDENIDFSDIPELDDTYWQEAELVEPDLTGEITLHVNRSVLAHFKTPGKGYERGSTACWKVTCGHDAITDSAIRDARITFAPSKAYQFDHLRTGLGTPCTGAAILTIEPAITAASG